jgi:hypothetical protein
MVSCLETRAITERNIQEARQNYNRENRYSATHPDALATGDRKGKGTGHGGHSHWLPNCNAQMGVFNYSNFDTAFESGAGNDLDNAARNASVTRSLYGPQNPYGHVDTTANRLEGQYVIN